ncbi:ribose-5-phosphate isomerase [Geoalkalibacter ferrihydriticus]|uniref:Ribose-5-phosphate isomerase n=1 Tax=Geoalkalibacter ferrihydriticus TaxID=392333 RepID=A0A1G9R329_9BACT|nr:ribose 5-phosphate isomerase B [Geoalkalibacter ferrihydriticus]SDM17267.1 ribose-5-phosphate isomerase [Geoalkalibacter ferrihydriticus]
MSEVIVIGSDHGGLALKEAVIGFLEMQGFKVDDVGTSNQESVDYPDFGEKVARLVSRGEVSRGILICGTGIGMSIVANKFPGVRAALATDEFMARMAKEHNNANIVVLGGRVITPESAQRMVAAWLEAAYEGGRHQQRLDKITRIEQEVAGLGS